MVKSNLKNNWRMPKKMLYYYTTNKRKKMEAYHEKRDPYIILFTICSKKKKSLFYHRSLWDGTTSIKSIACIKRKKKIVGKSCMRRKYKIPLCFFFIKKTRALRWPSESNATWKKKKKKRERETRRNPTFKKIKLCSNHSIRITAFTWIPSSMQWVHKPLISKAKEQTKAQ